MTGKTGEIRCSGCNKLLATGLIKDGTVKIICKCKTVNIIEVQAPKVQPLPFQERMNLVKKYDHLSFTIKQIPDGR